MLEFEQSKFSKTLRIKLKKQSNFFNLKLLKIIACVVFFHFIFFSIFKIKSFVDEPFVFKESVLIGFDIPFTKKMVDLDLNDKTLSTWLKAPPTSRLPNLSHGFEPFDEKPDLDYKKKTTASFKAFLRGPFAKELPLNDDLTNSLIELQPEESILLSIRNDEKGKVFWFTWNKKDKPLFLNQKIELWLKELKLPLESSFQAQEIEIL